jgi:hypothetical protein
MRLISAGFGSFNTNVDDVVLKANGTINWDAIFMFGYKGIGELTQIGKAITRNFYAMEENDKLYAYYQGCSEGGREGMSQIQRYGEEYDGVIRVRLRYDMRSSKSSICSRMLLSRHSTTTSRAASFSAS